MNGCGFPNDDTFYDDPQENTMTDNPQSLAQATAEYDQAVEHVNRVKHLAECMKHVGAANFGEFLDMAERYGVNDPDAVVAAYDQEQA